MQSSNSLSVDVAAGTLLVANSDPFQAKYIYRRGVDLTQPG